jgi:hypothetical protein
LSSTEWEGKRKVKISAIVHSMFFFQSGLAISFEKENIRARIWTFVSIGRLSKCLVMLNNIYIYIYIDTIWLDFSFSFSHIKAFLKVILNLALLESFTEKMIATSFSSIIFLYLILTLKPFSFLYLTSEKYIIEDS